MAMVSVPTVIKMLIWAHIVETVNELAFSKTMLRILGDLDFS